MSSTKLISLIALVILCAFVMESEAQYYYGNSYGYGAGSYYGYGGYGYPYSSYYGGYGYGYPSYGYYGKREAGFQPQQQQQNNQQ